MTCLIVFFISGHSDIYSGKSAEPKDRRQVNNKIILLELSKICDGEIRSF